jgi:DNA-directed RNA polymerase subunit M/transcription elongation factor TFIIS
MPPKKKAKIVKTSSSIFEEAVKPCHFTADHLCNHLESLPPVFAKRTGRKIIRLHESGQMRMFKTPAALLTYVNEPSNGLTVDFSVQNHPTDELGEVKRAIAKIAKDENLAVQRKNFVVCSKCKSADVSFTQKQTRSGDEGMTSFVTCNVCGNRRVFGG